MKAHAERLLAIVREIEFRDWKFVVAEFDGSSGTYYLVIEFKEACIVTGKPAVQRSRKWLLSEHMTRGEVVQTAWLAVQTALMHEAREAFKWRNELIFGPHFDIAELHALCVLGLTETRPPAPTPA